MGYFQFLRQHKAFGYLTAARTISMFGDWLTFFTLITLFQDSIYSAYLISAVFILKLLPYIVMSRWAGMVADGYSQRKVMIVANLASCFVTLGYFLIAPFGEYRTVIILVICFLQKGVSAFFEPARAAYAKAALPAEGLLRGNVINSTSWSFVHVLGIGASGIINNYFSWQTCVVLDAISFLISAAILFRLPELNNQAIRSKIRNSYSFLVFDRHWLYLSLLKSKWSLFSGLQVLLPLMTQKLSTSVLTMSALFVVRGMGGFMGPLVMERHMEKLTKKQNGIFTLSGFFLLSILFVLWKNSTAVYLIFIYAFFIFAIGGCLVTQSGFLIQSTIPNEHLGKVTAAEQGFATCSNILSLATSSFILHRYGVETLLSLFAMVSSILFFVNLRVLRIREGSNYDSA